MLLRASSEDELLLDAGVLELARERGGACSAHSGNTSSRRWSLTPRG
ncbi:MAG TPA: hypothetical protein VED41_12335 [Solirubrobacteraceae bacterium]|nr:hypothetical protein [Solirubrobacteraceae bacterium]